MSYSFTTEKDSPENFKKNDISLEKPLDFSQILSLFKEDKEVPVFLEKVRIHNFLSFEEDEVIFDRHLSVIFGPNGAGKSTILHAIKFALGSNNYDGRYKKWSEFINKKKDRAFVVLTVKVGPYRIEIRRSVDRKGTIKFVWKEAKEKKFRPLFSTYLKEFTLKSKLDPDNNFAFMTQGDVDLIKDLKPETLYLFVERGIHLSPLREKILEQKEKIERLNSNMEYLLREEESISYHLEEIEAKIKRLEEKRRLIKKREDLEFKLMFVEMSLIKKDLERNKKEYDALQKEIQQAEGLLHHLLDFRKELLDTINYVERKKERIKARVRNHQKRKIELEDIIGQLKQDYEALMKRKEELKDLRRINQKKLQSLRETIKSLKAKQEDIKRTLEKTKQSILILEQKSQNITNTLTQFSDLYDELYRKKSEKDKMHTLIEQYKKENDNLTRQIEEAIKEISEYKKELEKEKWFLKEPYPKLKAKLESQKEKLNERLERLHQLLEKVDREFYNYRKKYNDLMNSVKENKNLPKNLKILMEFIEQNNLKCKGPLINLIEFDKLYETAVSSLFGISNLYSFITEDSDTFLMLMEKIKRLHLRINIFLVSSSPRKSYFPNLRIDNDILGYMKDIIKPLENDISISRVVEDISAGTIVARNKSAALSFLKRTSKWNRIITLEGEFLNKKHNSIQGSLSYPSKLNLNTMLDLKKKIYVIEKEMEKNREYHLEITEKIQEYEKVLDMVKKRIERLKPLEWIFRVVDAKSKKKENYTLKRTKNFEMIKELEASIKELEKEIEDLNKKIPSDTKKIRFRLNKIKKSIKLLQNYKEHLWHKLTETNQKITSYSHEIDRINEELQAFEKEVSEIVSKLSKSDSSLMKTIKTLNRTISKIKLIKRFEEQNLHALSQYQSLLKEKDSKIDSLNFQLIEKNKKKALKENEINVLSNKIKKFEEKLKERDLSSFSVGSAEEIRKEIHALDKIIATYWDVDESILLEKKELKKALNNIFRKKQELNEDLMAARQAEKKYEEQYKQTFRNHIETLTSSINEKLKVAGTGIQISIKLTDDLHHPLLNIMSTLPGFSEKSDNVSLSALSGGQRTMVALSLMLSLNELDPSAVNIYDETDMFLDKKNASSIVTLMKKAIEKGTQFIIITPNPEKSFALLKISNKLIGVSRNGENGPSLIYYCNIPENL